jgi:predicted GNAT family acetyltransferase
MRMYRLGTLRAPTAVPGSGRRADSRDIDLVTTWLGAFHEEAMGSSPAEDFEAMARRRIASDQMWLWELDGEPVSLAGLNPPAVGVSRVGPVYTPPECRRHGYGAGVTALASKSAVNAGATHVVLYTDLSNPTSNSVYQQIGYEPHHDAEERDFVSPETVR